MTGIFIIIEGFDNIFLLDGINLSAMTNTKLLNVLQLNIRGFHPEEYFVLCNSEATEGRQSFKALGVKDLDLILIIKKTQELGVIDYEKQLDKLLRQNNHSTTHFLLVHKNVDSVEAAQDCLQMKRQRFAGFANFFRRLSIDDRLAKKCERGESAPLLLVERKQNEAGKLTFEPSYYLGTRGKEAKEPALAALYAPSQMKKELWEKVQVFVYNVDEQETVRKAAVEIDPSAEVKSYRPLEINLGTGDVLDITLFMYDEGVIVPQNKTHIIWQGSYNSCEFVIQIPKESHLESIAGEVIISLNKIQIGKLVFNSKVVEKEPRLTYSNVTAKAYKKIFISYSHKDQKKAEMVAKICRAQDLDYFFDRHTLNPGDDFENIINQYIRTSDLFILCWSKHAAKSEYVKKEYTQALEYSVPKKNPEDASLRICPFSIDPKANPPVEMAMLHFEEL